MQCIRAKSLRLPNVTLLLSCVRWLMPHKHGTVNKWNLLHRSDTHTTALLPFTMTPEQSLFMPGTPPGVLHQVLSHRPVPSGVKS